MMNIFDFFDAAESEPGVLAARAPRRPQPEFDLLLIPRVPDWKQDSRVLAALNHVQREPWAAEVRVARNFVRLRLDDRWIDSAGAALESGHDDDTDLGDLAAGQSFALQFWDANATKALHAGHLRNLAIGNGLAAGLMQAGANVERRSLINDAGRAMGEAMAGMLRFRAGRGGHPPLKSDHLVGRCYADYVATNAQSGEGADSMARELTVHRDKADELVGQMLRGDPQAAALRRSTCELVLSGQRQTLRRLGITFDRIFFEFDYLSAAARLTERGLREGTLTYRNDGTVVYGTRRRDYAELPIARSDGLPTEHMRFIAYWMTEAATLRRVRSVQVAGVEWATPTICRRQLMETWSRPGATAVHPLAGVFHGLVSIDGSALGSSKGSAPLIDDLLTWLDTQIDEDWQGGMLRRTHPAPDRIAAQTALAYFLSQPSTPPLDFDPTRLLNHTESLGWALSLAQARAAQGDAGSNADELDYRYAVVQSQLHRRHLRLLVQRLEVVSLARHLLRLAHWYLERNRSDRVSRVVRSVLDRGARGLGLMQAPAVS
ncbi:MAG TPA: arginine--tRNA ligase [Solirubrobacterales bacterium]|nr:arginine--tRNA ligase [Solirubrobacterales bacterium]